LKEDMTRDGKRKTSVVLRGTEPTLAQQLLAAAGLHRVRLVEMLAALTALDAPSGDPDALAEPASLLCSWLEEVGARVEAQPTAAGPLLEAKLDPGGSSGPLVLCHYDTVWPRGAAAERPFREVGGIACGPGVLDMRGGIVACLGALAILAELGLTACGARVLLTPDEETGSRCSIPAITAAAATSSIVLVPEPALPDGSLKTSRSGWLLARVIASGVAAHAGLEPERGSSAAHELLERLLELLALEDRAAGTTVNVGRLQAPNPANVVADSARATVDFRFADVAAENRLRAALAGLQADRPGATVSVEELHSRAPLVRTPAIAAAAAGARQLALGLGLELGEGHAGGVSDANLAAAAGAVVLDGLGPTGSGAHALDERVIVDSVVERTALLALLLSSPPNATAADDE
jgi:glutamate carboxypeptidase